MVIIELFETLFNAFWVFAGLAIMLAIYATFFWIIFMITRKILYGDWEDNKGQHSWETIIVSLLVAIVIFTYQFYSALIIAFLLILLVTVNWGDNVSDIKKIINEISNKKPREIKLE